MREDLRRRLTEGDQGQKDRVARVSPLGDPLDRGGGSFPISDDPRSRLEERNQCIPCLGEGLLCGDRRYSCIKDQSAMVEASQKLSHTTAMANQDQGKCKEQMAQNEVVASNGKVGLGSRAMVRGGSSRDRGDLYHTPDGQGPVMAGGARYGGNGHVVAPVFPVNMEVQAPHVVALDLSKERAAMRSRWIDRDATTDS